MRRGRAGRASSARSSSMPAGGAGAAAALITPPSSSPPAPRARARCAPDPVIWATNSSSNVAPSGASGETSRSSPIPRASADEPRTTSTVGSAQVTPWRAARSSISAAIARIWRSLRSLTRPAQVGVVRGVASRTRRAAASTPGRPRPSDDEVPRDRAQARLERVLREDDLGVRRHALVDVAVEDGEEQRVLAAREVRVDGALRVARLVGDPVERRPVEAVPLEHRARGGQEVAARPLPPLGTGQSRRVRAFRY